MLESSRRSPGRDTVQNKVIYNNFYQKLWQLELEYGKHDLMSLLTLPFEQLVSSAQKQVIAKQDPINWIGCSIVKGELMNKFLITAAYRFSKYLDRSSWSILLCHILWIRNRGALPTSISTISHVWTFPNHNTNVDFSKFQPSIFAMICNRRARGLKYGESNIIDKKDKPVSIFQSVTSLLFSSPSKRNSASEGTRDKISHKLILPEEFKITEDDEVSDLDVTFDLNSSVFSNYKSSSVESSINIDNMLAITLTDSPLCDLLQDASSEDVLDNNFTEITLVQVLPDLLLAITSALLFETKTSPRERDIELSFPDKSSGRNTYGSKSPTTSDNNSTRDEKDLKDIRAIISEANVSEMDVIFLMEILSRIVFADNKKLRIIWSKFHG
jgi:hypothetical protein